MEALGKIGIFLMVSPLIFGVGFILGNIFVYYTGFYWGFGGC